MRPCSEWSVLGRAANRVIFSGRSASQALVVTVSDVDETPQVVSHLGAAHVALTSLEGATAVTVVAATDPEGRAPAYSISGGADRARFAVDATTGALRWLGAADFETPADQGADKRVDQHEQRERDGGGARQAEAPLGLITALQAARIGFGARGRIMCGIRCLVDVSHRLRGTS